MVKQLFQRWLGIQKLVERMVVLEHHDTWREFDGLGSIIDESTDTTTYAGLHRVSFDGISHPMPGEVFEPEQGIPIYPVDDLHPAVAVTKGWQHDGQS